ncbi:MAG: Hsp33 family molecular chaperone HslO, partial [Rhodocyclaceae bacterium]|nr:Hsp33 family molecular chaperone HslO [Rhodocyclaceae bacterium]
MDATLSRFLFDELDARGAFVRLGSVWQSLQHRRAWPPAVARFCGELSAVAALI